jgi:hypothetical protein
VAEGSEQRWRVTVGNKSGTLSHTKTFTGTKEQAIKQAVKRFATTRNPVVTAELVEQGVAEGMMNEFAPGSGGGESGRWYTDDQMTDIVGDGWWQDLDISGNIPKQAMIQEAQAWLDDQGYNVQVLNCKLNDDDMEWYIEGSFQNSNFAKKGVAEGYQFKGPFPFDVDHMHSGRGINLPKAETKKYFTDKKQWQQAVDDINSSKYDDNSDYIGVTGRSTVEINGREWARWSDAQQKGYIELSSMSEQGVAEGSKDSAPKMGSQEKKLAQGALKGARDMAAVLGLVRGKDGVARPPETKKKGVAEAQPEPEQQQIDANRRAALRREREPAGSDAIDARLAQQHAQRQEYEKTGKFWIKRKDNQQHISDVIVGKAAANAAALELLKQQPELRGNIVITAYGPGESQGVAEDMTRRGFLRGLGAAALGAAGLGAAGAAQGRVTFDKDGKPINPPDWKNLRGSAPAQGAKPLPAANTASSAGSASSSSQTAGAASSPSAASRAAANQASALAEKIRYTNPKFNQEYERIEKFYQQTKSSILNNERYSSNPDIAKRQHAEFVKMLIAADTEFAQKTNALLKDYGALREQGVAENNDPYKPEPYDEFASDTYGDDNPEDQQGVAEGNKEEKIGGRHDADDFDDMVSRLKKLAGAGPMKTVYDPNTRRYKNVPVTPQSGDKK